jgi:hypothetical protein
MLAPELWDSSDNTEAIAACRQQCPRRFPCAQEALAGPKHLVSTLNGVIAGVAIPAQNEYGTSKSHRAALKRLETIAAQGNRISAATTTPRSRAQRPAAPGGQDRAHPSSAIKQTQPSVVGQQLGPAHEPPGRHQSEVTKALRVPPGDWGAEIESCYRRPIPKGQVDVYGAARMTGLKVATLRHYRQIGRGPKSWLTPEGPRGCIRYWVTDIEAWMAQHEKRRFAPVARAS